MKSKKITDEDFVRIWNNAETTKSVSATIGQTVRQAICRAYYLRKCGFVLKKFKTGRRTEPVRIILW